MTSGCFGAVATTEDAKMIVIVIITITDIEKTKTLKTYLTL